MHLSKSTTPEPIASSLDRQSLATLQQRFLQVNEGRLERTRMALSHQQEVLLNTLPLLFHCNHPMLPGFVSHNTPSGVSNYTPSRRDLAYAKSLARSFCSIGGYYGENIWGIYLMGSMGTLAQSQHSDFDIWLCHNPELPANALAELQQKCQRISRWAKTLRLDVHFFLMDCEAFVAGQALGLDAESSGSAQRMLLLDEFYRTALYIAGRLPLWWFVPPAQEPNYQPLCQHLLERRFLRPQTILDFGAILQIPDGEFIGAGIWQLYKAIASPYKAVLKLLLMEAYAHGNAQIAPLSLDYKTQIYAGNVQLDELDPYVMIYRRLESYLLSQGEHGRLELVRRCLYFKVNKALSRHSSQRNKSWQRALLEHLTQQWGWDKDYIATLDQRRHWKTLRVKEERNQLVRALNHSYAVLQDFSQRSNTARAISTTELVVLGRKLQAAFERRPGKLDCINPGISSDISEPVLHFIEVPAGNSKNGQTLWQLCGGEAGTDAPLRQSNSPVELLLWCYTNRIIDGHVRFELSRAASVNETQLKRTLAQIAQWLPLPLPALEHATFESAAVPSQVLVLINIGAETPSPFGAHTHRLSDNGDPLCYGGLHENLIASVDVVVRNSWQEFTCHRFNGREAIVHALQEYMSLCLPGSHQAPPELQVECVGNSHTALIGQRCRQWFNDIATCYYSGTKPPATRYISVLGKTYYSLQFRGPALEVREHKTVAQLLRYLGESQRRYSPLVIDKYTLLGHPLKLIAKRARARSLGVFYERRGGQVRLYVVDEKGSVTFCQSELACGAQFLHQLQSFLHRTLTKIAQQDGNTSPVQASPRPVELFELSKNNLGQPMLTPRLAANGTKHLDRQQLLANVSCNSGGQFEYSFAVHGRDFAWHTLHKEVFDATAQYLLNQGATSRNQPIYIDDLNLEQCQEPLGSSHNLQTSHYLRIKIQIEKKLKHAAARLNG